MNLWTGIEINLAGNTCKAPEVLIFEIRAVAPAHDLHGNEVLAFLQVFGNIELSSNLGILAVAHITSIHPNLQIAGGRTDMEQHLLTLPIIGQRELTTIAARVVLRLANVGRIAVERGAPSITDVLVDRVAMTVELEKSRNREIFPLGIIEVRTEKRCRSILMVLHKMKTPHAFHRQIA